MKVSLLFTTLFALFFSQFTFAVTDNLPNRQRRLAIFNVQRSSTGQALVQQFNDEEHMYKSIYIGEPPATELFYLDEDSNFTIFLSGNLMAAAPVYNSWVLAIALQVRKLTTECGVRNIHEYTQWAFIQAQKHWIGIDSPNEEDYAKHPNRNIREYPLSLDASVSKYSRLYSRLSKSDFAQSVKERALQLGQPLITLDEKIASLDPQRNPRLISCLKAQKESFERLID